MESSIMYIEKKEDNEILDSGGLSGDAIIARVTFSKTGKTIYCKGQAFRSLKGQGFKSNYYNVETVEEYWISGCKKNGQDRLYGERVPVQIDDECREDYWLKIRKQPDKLNQKTTF